MIIKNFTPHDVVLNGVVYHSIGLARCESTQVQIKTINGIPVYRKSFGKITGLPEGETDTIYIVSAIVAQAAKELGRSDLVVVNDTIHNEEGQIIGCSSLAII